AAVQEVRRQLENSAYVQWQVVFLTHIDQYQNSAYSDSLSAKMLLIRKLFLENELLISKPKSSYFIVADHVNEDETIPSIHLSKVYRNSWELDTKGFIHDPVQFFVAKPDIEQLDKIWKSKVTVNRGVIVSEGFHRLPQELQESVLSAITTISSRVGELLNPKKVDFSRFPVNRSLSYIDESLFKAIKKEFMTRLTNIKDDPSRYNAFSPSKTLMSAIAQQIGVFSNENRYTFDFIRFPMQYSHEDILQRYLLKLAILLTLIADEENIVRDLPKEHNHVFKLNLNDVQVKRVMQSYFEHLHNMESRLETQLNNEKPVRLQMRENEDCGCAETLNTKQMEALEFEFFKQNADMQRWQSWNEEVKTDLKAHRREAQRKMQNCIGEMYRHDAKVKTEEVKKINHKIEDLARKKGDLQEQVKHEFLTKKIPVEWEAYQKEQGGRLKFWLINRPTLRQVLIILSLSVVALGVPFVNYQIAGEGSDINALYYALVALLSIVLCLIAFFMARGKWMDRIEKLFLEVFHQARNIRTNVNDDFDRQKAYLDSLCQLNVVRTNHGSALEAQNEQNNRNVLIDHHRKKLDEHQNIAQKILHIFKASGQISAYQFKDDEVPVPNVGEPIEQNDIYAPTTFIPKKTAEAVKAENKIFRINNRIETLISDISFEKDRIYSLETKF
ncbi:MAG: hypothetical protein ACPGXL_09530, partial [Chitinophagales bacterium]